MNLYLVVASEVELAIERYDTNEDAFGDWRTMIVRAESEQQARQIAHDFVFDEPDEPSWFKDTDCTRCLTIPTTGNPVVLAHGDIYNWDDELDSSE